MMRRTIALFVCMALCWISVPSHAAEISCAPADPTGGMTLEEALAAGYDVGGPDQGNPKGMTLEQARAAGLLAPDTSCISGLLSGQISRGDYKKVAALLKAHNPFINTFRLNSPGGNLDEALKIGRLFRKYLIATRVDVACASACAFIWFGGVDRGGTVGLHRPRTDDPVFKGSPPADASTEYRRVLGRIASYLDEMEAPKTIIEKVTATGSANIYWINASSDELRRPPSIAEWEDASCGLVLRDVDDVNKSWCAHLLLSSHRKRLAPP
jgi:hypothetical protein